MARGQTAPAVVAIGTTDIGGTVTSPHGPEAGVWVIAETTDLPTKFAKIVVTDDAGRYVIPSLPAAKYKVWVRGYGLVDSPRVDGEPGKTLDLAATLAPTPAAAAKYYPGMYWYSMLRIPAADQFPGTGDEGNGIPPFLRTQGNWIDTVKNSCQSCHALGSSTDKRHPTVNANGYIYGSPEESTDNVPVLDPVANKTWTVTHPYRPGTPSSLDEPKGTSVFWGDDLIWDGHTSNHNLIFDENGLLWFAARSRGPDDPAYCRKGSDLPAAKVAPLETSVRQLSVFDPKTQQFNLIDTCFTTQHLYFGHDADNTLWTSAGSPAAPVIGWLDTKKFLASHDAEASQGWSPMIVDVPGWGKRGDYVEVDQPIDPAKQKRVLAGIYGVQPSPVDDTIWGQSMDVGFSRMDQPGYLVHFIPGPDPVHTGLTELFQPPPGSYGPRGTDVDTKGIVWTALSSGHLASFDRSKCKAPLTGPNAATGLQCVEGWTLYRFPGPQFEGVDASGSANHAYYVWVDRYNTFGLGENVPMAMTNGGEAITALVDGKFLQFHVPYPAGFFSKNVDGRIDDPNAGWKGRGLWTTNGTRTMFHNETGKGERPRVFHIQLRPDPLAH